MKIAWTIILSFVLLGTIPAQTGFIEKEIQITIDSSEITPNEWPVFNELSEYNEIAYYEDISSLNSRVTASFEISEEVWLPSPVSIPNNPVADEDLFLQFADQAGRNTTTIKTYIHPFRLNGNQWEYLQSFRLKIYYDELPPKPLSEVLSSHLAEGQLFQFPVEEEGFYKIDYNYIDALPSVDASTLNPAQVMLLGTSGGPLPESNRDQKHRQLPELPLHFEGDSDNQLEPGEYFVFYAFGSDKWTCDNEADLSYSYEKNIYDNRNYYILNITDNAGQRAAVQSYQSNGPVLNAYDKLYHHEKDERNLLYESAAFYGSGQLWLGESFRNSPVTSFLELNLADRAPDSELHAELAMAIRNNRSSRFYLTANGENVASEQTPATTLSTTTGNYAHYDRLNHSWTPAEDLVSLGLNYPESGTAWLDYISASYSARLNYDANVAGGFRFSNKEAANTNFVEFDLNGLPNKPIAVKLGVNGYISILEINNGRISDENEGAVYFYGIADLNALSSPRDAQPIENKDILDQTDLDLLIVYPEKFEEQALRLADHRRNFNQLKVEAVPLQDIYNEFTGGRADVTAVREYCRYLFETSSSFNYLLLFGGGTFDVRNLYGQNEKLAYVPTYETKNSLNGIRAYPSDDYFALLNENEGGDIGTGSVDVGVGRLPVNTEAQARTVVDKLIAYDTDPATFGDWRTYLTFMADDEDSNRHFKDADDVAQSTKRNYQNFNVDKIYWDAYKQESTSGGPRYPDAKEALNDNLSEGRLAICYLGHGSYRGLSQERVVVADDISNWNNVNKYPLLITATCSFSAYDDPSFYSAGELTFLKENGGTIGLFTTTRLVYASGNKHLTDDVYDNLFERDAAGMPKRLGDVIRLAKNENVGNNTRKFSLLGDPSMRLAMPLYQVQTTYINGQSVENINTDTLNALEPLFLEGDIRDYNDKLLSDFNGEITVTVFDKEQTLSTLGQDRRSQVADFKLRNTVLFKGVASVVNGEWALEFILPQDIDFEIGQGKISYYAHDGVHKDAWGTYENIYIGGINEDAEEDNEAPNVDVYINDANFEFGGITDQFPSLYVELNDDQGINISSSGIGRTPFALLNDGEQRYALERFYRSNTNDSRSGTISYPMGRLEPGRYRVEVKAWDIQNNSGTGYTEFVVLKNDEKLIENLINYPNPFVNSTIFAFEHTLAGANANVYVDIFNASGQRVHVLEVDNINLGGYRVDGIKWKGDGSNGLSLSNGVYFYRVRLETLGTETRKYESQTKKLMLIK